MIGRASPYVNISTAPSEEYPAALDDDSTLAWYIDDAAYLTKSGDSVSQWSDVSGNGNHLLQSNPAYRPIWSADSGLMFNGTDDCLELASFVLDAPWSLYMVVLQDSWTETDAIISFSKYNTGSGNVYVGQTALSPRIRLMLDDELILTGTESTNLGLDTLGVVTFINRTLSYGQINNYTAVTWALALRPMAYVWLGEGYGLGFGDIHVKEIIIRNGDDGTTNRETIRDYLINKYL